MKFQGNPNEISSNTGFCANAYPKYARQENIPSDPGCIGEYDLCGVCNGDSSTCCTNPCEDPNSHCEVNKCVCNSGYLLEDNGTVCALDKESDSINVSYSFGLITTFIIVLLNLI